jgi:hypothetical protein
MDAGVLTVVSCIVCTKSLEYEPFLSSQFSSDSVMSSGPGNSSDTISPSLRVTDDTLTRVEKMEWNDIDYTHHISLFSFSAKTRL